MSRRSYGGSNLGSYAAFNRTVATKDVLVGIGIGLVGAGVAAYGLKKARSMVNPISFLAPGVNNDFVKLAVPAVGGAAAGFAAWTFRKHRARQAAFANFLGAAGAGVAISLWPKVAETVGFAGTVGLDLPYGGLIIDDQEPGYHGMLVDDDPRLHPAGFRGYADRSGMGALAQASLDPDEDYGELARLASFSRTHNA